MKKLLLGVVATLFFAYQALADYTFIVPETGSGTSVWTDCSKGT